jgi:hypothetical protein
MKKTLKMREEGLTTRGGVDGEALSVVAVAGARGPVRSNA